MNEPKRGGRPEKPHVAKHLLLAKQIVVEAESVREPKETFTALVETALVRETKHRNRARRKRQVSD